MIYTKVKDGSVEKYPYSISDLKKDNPNVSFPRTLSTDTLNTFGAFEVKTEPEPDYNSITQTLTKKSTPELVSGVWTLKWEIKDKPQEDIDQEKADNQADIRNERGMMLEESDWTVLSDAPLSTEMVAKYKTFRQELRDVTKQSTFNEAVPSVTWPTKPS